MFSGFVSQLGATDNWISEWRRGDGFPCQSPGDLITGIRPLCPLSRHVRPGIMEGEDISLNAWIDQTISDNFPSYRMPTVAQHAENIAITSTLHSITADQRHRPELKDVAVPLSPVGDGTSGKADKPLDQRIEQGAIIDTRRWSGDRSPAPDTLRWSVMRRRIASSFACSAFCRATAARVRTPIGL